MTNVESGERNLSFVQKGRGMQYGAENVADTMRVFLLLWEERVSLDLFSAVWPPEHPGFSSLSGLL